MTIERDVAPVSVELASHRMDDVFAGVRGVINFLGYVASSQEQVPRELELTVRWFFARAARLSGAPHYCLFIAEELTTLDFKVLLDHLFNPAVQPRRSTFPKLTAAFASKTFCFISVPAPMASLRTSIDWPLVFHECVHVLETVAPLVPRLYPTLPKDRLLLMYRAEHGDTHAQEALWTEELLCDFVATYIAGPAFAWRFLRQYFSILGVSYRSLTHPPVDVRIRRLINLIDGLGFKAQAKLTERLLDELLKDLKSYPPVPLPNALVAADQIEADCKSKLQPFDAGTYQDILRERCRAVDSRLLQDILNRRPVVVDPGCLFTIVAFSSQCEDPGICVLLADFMRLHAVESRFQELGLRG